MNPIKLSIKRTEYITDNKTYTKCILSCRLKGQDLLPITAIARIKENDKFDFELGCKIALAKAERKAYKYVRDVIKSEFKRLSILIDNMTDFAIKSNKIIKHNTEYIKKIAK